MPGKQHKPKLKAPVKSPNAKTIKAMKDARTGKTKKLTNTKAWIKKTTDLQKSYKKADEINKKVKKNNIGIDEIDEAVKNVRNSKKLTDSESNYKPFLETLAKAERKDLIETIKRELPHSIKEKKQAKKLLSQAVIKKPKKKPLSKKLKKTDGSSSRASIKSFVEDFYKKTW